MITFRLIGPRPRLLRSPSEKAADAIERIDRSVSIQTRSAWTIDAIDRALSQRRDVDFVELYDWPPCYYCSAPHPDPGTPCPRCHDGTVGARAEAMQRSSDTRPVGPVYHHPGGAILSIR
jgi:hypothetical protein